MRRRPSVATQVGAPVAAASLAVGGAYLRVDVQVGIPLLSVGAVVTYWIVWEAWRENRARRAVRQLVIAASRRLAEYENAWPPPTREALVEYCNTEAEWVHAALGHMEARLLLDTSREPIATRNRVPDPVKRELRGFRANLDDLHKRLPGLDLERDFKSSKWKDKL